MKSKLLIILVVFFQFLTVFSQNKSLEISTKNSVLKPLRQYHTVRLSTEKPVIDGKLNDDCWKTGEWSGDYTQWIPNEGAKPSQPTQLKILYDDKNIYVAIRAFDSIPQKISLKSGRRDDFLGDMAGVTFDSYHDRRTGFEFDVSAAGQKTDLLITNPSNVDLNWNAVWQAKTAMEDSAWTAEFKMPLNQLRYSNDSVQVWGLHAWRWIDRFQQESVWEPQTYTGPGILYLFGELHGINGLPKSRRIEIMPYLSVKFNTFPKEPCNPSMDDNVVPVQNSMVYALALKKHNIPCELHLYQSGGRGYGLGKTTNTESTWPNACRKWLEARGLLIKK